MVVVAAIAFDLMNGFHDECNAGSTVIYTKALKPRTAIMISAAMALGTYLSVLSMRLVRTLGEGITQLHPVHGFSAETGTGLASGLSNVGWRTFRDIILSWLITLPFCAGVAAASYYVL